ncbi:MAG: hypothetical protein JXQ27_12365 [Acidobacteria bacterium]|nr:hypothetical protein [Acidobacteriota bacterium]
MKSIVIVGLMMLTTTVWLGGAIPQTERDALIALYNSTGGDQWSNKENWLGAAGTECTWHGVTCDNDGNHVVEINLSYNNLTGSIPSAISALTSMHSFSLYYNQIEGPIPSEMGSLSNLGDLRLYGNRLSGPIPTQLGNLTNLSHLSLHTNRLEGPIPTELGSLTNLYYLKLGYNMLTGTIPTEVMNIPTLFILEVPGNQLTGPIPTGLANLTNLATLDLNSNQFTGQIPTELASMTSLSRLEVGGNQLTGTIPTQLGEMPNLGYLNVAANQLTGTIPVTAKNFSALRQLFAYDNQFSGPFPAGLTSRDMVELDLAMNNFHGPLPTEIGNWTKMSYLSLYRNNFSGPLPTELGNLTDVLWFYLDRNRLEGPIPSELGNMTNVRFINLGENSLTGNIPTELANLPNMSNLNLSGNMLAGEIPAGIKDFTTLGRFGLNIFYNALYSSDQTVIDFVENHHAGSGYVDFRDRQTVAPENVMLNLVTKVVAGEIEWDLIRYTEDDGGYEILMATTPGGPYHVMGMTGDKTVDTYALECLPPGADLYVVVRSVTYPHPDNPNTVISGYSQEAHVTTPGVKGDLNDDAQVTMADVDLLADYLVEKRYSFPNCTAAGDVNGDFVINVVDLLLLRTMMNP